ncbi:Solute carrier family 40 member [Lachnellula subtilissima]|uniref:Solute carrier family 40 member n=1 Tax=Lachnellula subtilissima TaxID=602034 RepID=A0A8H8S0H1_9HELO|nr:Solute carrier family 40 member [Lachnellula subtilissima]
MVAESGRSSSISLSGSADDFISPSQRHPRDTSTGENDMMDEGRKNSEEGMRDSEVLSDCSVDMPVSKILQQTDRVKWWKVYLMHFLFMWNSRTYEYASIFLIASAFPESLTATSIRGLASTISALLCSSAVGSWIDKSPSRLRTLLITICVNHTAMVAAYLCWIFWPMDPDDSSQLKGTPFSDLAKGMLFGGILFLDIVHDLSAIGYRLCLERDWVPVLVGQITAEMDYSLTQVNSVMMRIELICKLLAPSLLPLIVKSFNSPTGWILVIAASTISFWAFGVCCVRVIARGNVQLQLPKQIFTLLNGARNFTTEDTFTFPQLPSRSWPRKIYGFMYRDPATRLKHYFSFPMWPASISIALLQLTVLAYSATLITHLLEIGFSLSAITVARASGSILGLLGTIITPTAVAYLKKRYTQKLSPTRKRNEEDDKVVEAAVTRTVGFWGLTSQFLCLIPVVILLWNASDRAMGGHETVASPHVLITITLFAFLSLSRVGHFANYLMVQELGQVEIPVSQRSTFAGVEQSFKSLGELSHWLATIVWSQPEEFRWLALGSFLVTGLSVGLFGTWVRTKKSSLEGSGGEYDEIPLTDVINNEHEEHRNLTRHF